MMFKLIHKLTQLGMDPLAGFSEKKKITLINSMSMLLFTIYFAFFFVSESRFMVNNATMAAAQIPPMLLNYYRRHKTGTFIFIYSNLLILLYLTLMYGHALGAAYAMICWGLVVAYIFDNYKDMLPHAIIGGILFIGANRYIFTSGPLEPIPQDFVGITVVGLCFFVPVIVSRIYKAEHENYQEIVKETNRLLNRQSQEILEQMTTLENRNKKIESQRYTIEHAYKEIQSSIRYAQRIQAAMLPLRESLYESFPEHCLFYQPKDIVSGDFYWFKKIGNQCIVAVADCTGHGVPGAFMNAIGNTLLNQLVDSRTIYRPDEVLSMLNGHLTNVFSQSSGEHGRINDGMEIALCTIDFNGKKIFFSSSKRPLYIIRKGELNDIKGSKHSVDGCSDCPKDYGFTEISYATGDMLYLFSDGYADQFGGDLKKKMKISCFRQTLLDIATAPAQTQEMLLKYQFDTWKGYNEQIDDVLVLGLKL
jgi:hypothetical protein